MNASRTVADGTLEKVSTALTWSAAMQRALYAPGGFYASGRGPGTDYRTSSTATPAFARAVLELLRRVDAALGHPDELQLVEVAAASGLLLENVRALADPELRARLSLHGVELRPRPQDLDDSIEWSRDIPTTTGLLIANEWLDNIPLDVVELTEDGMRQVLEDDSYGDVVDDPWVRQWWPLEQEGDRAEIGTPRDLAWASAVAHVERGLAVHIDYCTLLEDRRDGAYPMGTLTGYRDGRQCDPVPDGSCDITAHVSIDSVAAAAIAEDTLLVDQRTALRRLGLTGARPSAGSPDLLASLVAAGEEGELLLPPLGEMTWLLQAKGCDLSLVMGWAGERNRDRRPQEDLLDQGRSRRGREGHQPHDRGG